MSVRFIPELAGIVPYQPGLPIEVVQRRYGLDTVVKLASNEFPLPPFPEVKAVVLGALDRLQRYPDGFSTDLRTALAEHFDRSPEQITVGCGTCELLYLLAHATLERGDEVVLAEPSFTSYRDVIDIRGAVPVAVPLVDHAHDLEAMAAAVTPQHQDRLRLQPQQPHGDLPAFGRGQALRGAGAGRRHGGHRRGVHRVRHGRRTARGRWGSRRSTTTSSCCARSPRSTGSAGCAPASASARRRSSGRRQGATAVQREPARAARRHRGAQAPGQGGGAPRDQRPRCATSWSARLAERGRATVPRRRTSCSWT